MSPKNTRLVDAGEWREHCSSIVGVDFETFYSTGYSVSKLGNWAYCHDPQFSAYLLAVSNGILTCVSPPEEFPWDSISGLEWVSHNRDFDQSIWRRLKELNLINYNLSGPSKWHCSAAACAYLQLPRSLAGASRDVLGQTMDKTVRSKTKGRDPEDESYVLSDEVKQYAARDAEATLALWGELEGRWPEHERCLFEHTAAMGRGGLKLDWKYVAEKKDRLVVALNGLTGILPWTPSLSLKQFRLACESFGTTPPSSTAVTDPGFMEWSKKNRCGQAAEWIGTMQKIRSTNRTAKVFESMQKRRMPNGRMAYDLKYFGASTGRWSGGGGLNMQNLNRTAAEGVDIRRAIIASPGCRLVVADYSQIESRVILYLAGDWESLSMFREDPDADAYEIHARRTMGYSDPEPLKLYCERTGSKLRQLAKARVLGLGFGCGWKRFIEVALSMAGLELSEQESRKVVKEFRDSNPAVMRLWQRLEDACESCAGKDYILPLPCTQSNPELKRYLFYRNVKICRRGIECTVNGNRTKVYGGLLAENWTQAAARDVLASAWLRCVAAGFNPILSVHDELVFEVPGSSAEEDLKQIIEIMETPMEWASNLPLRVEGKLMDFYSK